LFTGQSQDFACEGVINMPGESGADFPGTGVSVDRHGGQGKL